METKEVEEELLKDVLTNSRELILFNDDYNTFDFVIDCLISICDHDATQAEQCAYIVHHNGKCLVKKGSVDKIYAMYQSLKLKNLIVEMR